MNTYILTEDNRKRLTLFLGECWHEKSGTSYFAPFIRGFPVIPDSFLCSKCNTKFRESDNRTFTTLDDRQALAEKLMEIEKEAICRQPEHVHTKLHIGMWIKFENFCTNIFDSDRVQLHSRSFSYWLLVEQPERFCGLVDEFLSTSEMVKRIGETGETPPSPWVE